MSQTHQTIPTLSPTERALLVKVNETTFASNGGEIPAINTLYNDNEFRTFFGKDYHKEFAGFRYVEQRGNVEGDKGDGGMDATLLFVKSKTAAEIATPFRTYTEVRTHGWNAVVAWIKFNQEYGFPLSQNYIYGAGQQGIATVARWLIQYSYVPAMELQTIVRVREFLSDIPYQDWQVESDDPKPTPISWDLIGSQGNLGKCLHPEIIVPGQSNNSGIRVALNAGQFLSSNSTQQGQKFYATNHQTWRDYTINTVKFVDGQYHRVEETFVAPTIPKASIVQS